MSTQDPGPESAAPETPPVAPDMSFGDVAVAEGVPSVSDGKNYQLQLVYWLLAAFLLRLFIIRFPYMFTLDVNTFRSWGDTIVKVGPAQFYTNTWSDYPPLFMYFLWIWGHIQAPFSGSTMMSPQWAKLPACIADIACGYIIFKLLAGRVAIRSAFRTAVFYVFNPVIIFVSAVWGQVDAIICTMMLVISLAVLGNRLYVAAALCAAALLIKPQGLFILPVVFFALWYKNPVWKWFVATGIGVVTTWVLLLPANWHKLGGWISITGQAYENTPPALTPDMMTHVPEAFRFFYGWLFTHLAFPALFAQPFFWLYNQMKATGDNYPHSTVNAFNIWMLPPPNETWKPDDRKLFFLSHANWGMIFCLTLLALVGWYLYRNRKLQSSFPYFLSAAVTLTGFYMLATRMHERYIFPAMAFLALAAACNRRLNWVYWAISLTSFLSIAYIFFFYNDTSAWVEGLKTMMNNGYMLGSLKLSGMVLLSLVNVWLFGELLSFLFVKGDMVTELAEHPLVRQIRTLRTTIKVDALDQRDFLVPLVICLTFFFVALIRLGIPNEQIFDEVYHARTAMEYINGISPYEWTHPPLAKLLAALGIMATGGQFALDAKTWTEHMAFAWRVTSVIFGALTLGVTYALARSLFENRAIATVTTILLALDGVFFVQSRVAMTNIYEVFFIMLGTLGTWLAVKRNQDRWMLLTAFGIGCALATRWSSLYAWGITGLFLIWHTYRTKRVEWVAEPAESPAQLWRDFLAANKLAMAKWVGWVAFTMGVIPVAIYLLTYIPYLLQDDGTVIGKLTNLDRGDHSWWKVITWQKDMWGYHANLNATHPYSSPWWSWPIMLRPTWYYFHDWKDIPGRSGISGVWAIGNAFIWWASIPALLFTAWHAQRDNLRSLGMISAFGLALWIMWGVQPRPLLYMHYMFESIPFACMALAYIGYVFWYGTSEGEDDRVRAVADGPVGPAATPPAAEQPATAVVGGETAAAETVVAAGDTTVMTAPEPALADAIVLPLSPKQRRILVGVWAGLIVAWFIFFYPLLAAWPIPWDLYNAHIWFGRAWI